MIQTKPKQVKLFVDNNGAYHKTEELAIQANNKLEISSLRQQLKGFFLNSGATKSIKQNDYTSSKERDEIVAFNEGFITCVNRIVNDPLRVRDKLDEYLRELSDYLD